MVAETWWFFISHSPLIIYMLPRAAFYPPPDSLDPHPFFPHGIGQLTMFAGEFSFAINNFQANLFTIL